MWTIVCCATFAPKSGVPRPKDGVDRGAVDQHEDHDARLPEYLGRTRRHACAGCAQWLALVRGTVPDDERRSRTGQIDRLGVSEDTETDEAYVHSCWVS